MEIHGEVDNLSVRRAAQQVADEFEREFARRDPFQRMFGSTQMRRAAQQAADEFARAFSRRDLFGGGRDREVTARVSGLWAAIGGAAAAAFVSSLAAGISTRLPGALASVLSSPGMNRALRQDVEHNLRQSLRSVLSQTEITQIIEPIAKKTSRSFWMAAFRPDPSFLRFLRTGVPAILASPVGIAALTLGALFAVTFVGAVITSFATAGLGAAIVAAAVAGLIATDEKVKEAVNRWVETIKGVFTRSIKPIAAPLIAAFGLFEESLTRMEPTLTRIFEALAPAITPLAEGMIGFVEEFLKVLTADPQTMKDIAEALAEMGRQLPGLGKAMGEFFKTLSENEDNIRNIQTIFSMLNATIKAFGVLLSFLATEFRKFVDFVKQTVDDVEFELNRLKGAFNNFSLFVRTSFNAVENGIRIAVGGIQRQFLNFAGFVGGTINRVVGAFASLPGRIIAIFRQIIDIAFDAGAQIASNVAAGIRSRIPSAASAAAALGSIIRRFLPGSPVKQGPLRILNNGQAGREIVQMLAGGIRSESGLLNRELDNLLTPAKAADTDNRQRGNVVQNFYITTQEIDPRVHSAQLGWELAGRL